MKRSSTEQRSPIYINKEQPVSIVRGNYGVLWPLWEILKDADPQNAVCLSAAPSGTNN